VEHFRDLVETLSRSIITGAPQYDIVSPLRTIVQIRMPARDNKCKVRSRHGRIFEINRTDVPLKVMDGYERLPRAIGQGFRQRDTYQQGTH
jgi:hypothetical protein